MKPDQNHFMYQVGDRVGLIDGYGRDNQTNCGTIVKQGRLGAFKHKSGFDHTYDLLWDGEDTVDTAGWFERALVLIESVQDPELFAAKQKWVEFFNANS